MRVAVRRATLRERKRAYLDEQEAVLAIAPKGAWPDRAMLQLTVDDGLRSGAGPLPLGRPWHAHVHVRRDFDVLGLRCEGGEDDRCPLGAVTIATTASLSAEAIDRITVRPRPRELSIEQHWFNDDDDDDVPAALHDPQVDTHIVIDGEFVPGKRYEVVFPAGLQDDDGRPLPRSRRVVFEPTKTPARGRAWMALGSSGGIFSTLDDAKVSLRASRVSELKIRIATLDADDPRATAWERTDAKQLLAWPEDAPQVTLLRSVAPADRGRTVAVDFDLGRHASLGQTVVVHVEPVAVVPRTIDGLPEPVRGVYRLSSMAVTTHVGPARGVAHVTAVRDGASLPDVEVSLIGDGTPRRLGTTDRDGLLAIPGAAALDPDTRLFVSGPGDGLAMTLTQPTWREARGPVSTRWNRYIWHHRSRRTTEMTPVAGLRRGESGLVAVRVGRGVYMPGDPVHIAGWAAVSTPFGDAATRRAPVGSDVTLRLRRRGDDVLTRTVKVGEHGRFSETIEIPASARLGDYSIEATLFEATSQTYFEVSEVRIPTFEVQVNPARRRVLSGEPIDLRVDAAYLSGEPAPLRAVLWSMHCRAGAPQMEHLPAGYRAHTDARLETIYRSDSETVRSLPTAQVSLETGYFPTDTGQFCEIDVSAADKSFQLQGSQVTVSVHPATAYFAHRLTTEGMTERERKAQNTWLKVGDRAIVDLIVVDHDGTRVEQADITAKIVRYQDGDRVDIKPPTPFARCSLAVGASGKPAQCQTAPLKLGRYRATLRTTVDGRPITQVREFRVIKRRRPPRAARRGSRAAGATKPTEVRRSFGLEVPSTLAPDSPATITIGGPWEDQRGVLAVEQTGLRQTIPFRIRDGEATVTVTPSAAQGSVVEFVAWVRSGLSVERTHASVPVEATKLEVAVSAPKHARPGTEVPIAIAVTDEEGQPARARLAVWVIDEGLQQLRRPHWPDLFAVFNPARVRERATTDSIVDVIRTDATRFYRRAKRVPRVRQARAMVKGALDDDTRSEFNSAPLFVGDVGTDADGNAALTLSLPDNLTRFEIFAVASTERAEAPGVPAVFGYGQATVAVRAPLNVRLAIPRALRPSDRADIAALVVAPSDGTLEVSLDASGDAVETKGPRTQSMSVRAGDVARVRFDLRAQKAGDGTLRATARFAPADGGKPKRGGVQRVVPVVVERTTIERAARYGSLAQDRPVAIPVIIPDGARPDVGGVAVSTTATAIGQLDDAASYLVDYPYGCLEQTSSRLLPLVALNGLSHRLSLPPQEIRKRAEEAIARIVSMQLSSGRLGYWPGASEPAGFAEGYALWVLAMAQQAGLSVPAAPTQAARDALVAWLAQPPPEASTQRRSHEAAEFAMALLGLGADAPPAAIDALYERRAQLRFSGMAMLTMAMHAVDPNDPRLTTLQGAISAAIEERPGAAHVAGGDSGRLLRVFDSGARDDALAIMVLLATSPDDRRIDKLVAGLRDRRRSGRWRTTQENAFALVALSQYAATAEAVPPRHRIRAWVGGKVALDGQHRGYDSPANVGAVPMAVLAPALGSDRTTPLVLQREGDGRVHYRVGLQWATDDAPPRAQGLTLQTHVLDAEDTPAAPLQIGDTYALDVVLSTRAAQHHVAVEVPLPAGLEAIETDLGGGTRARLGKIEPLHSRWVSHMELRSDRVLLFFDELPAGTYRHRVPVLATTPGTFTLPAAVAEAMYEPETRARTAVRQVEVSRP